MIGSMTFSLTFGYPSFTAPRIQSFVPFTLARLLCSRQVPTVFAEWLPFPYQFRHRMELVLAYGEPCDERELPKQLY